MTFPLPLKLSAAAIVAASLGFAAPALAQETDTVTYRIGDETYVATVEVQDDGTLVILDYGTDLSDEQQAAVDDAVDTRNDFVQSAQEDGTLSERQQEFEETAAENGWEAPEEEEIETAMNDARDSIQDSIDAAVSEHRADN